MQQIPESDFLVLDYIGSHFPTCHKFSFSKSWIFFDYQLVSPFHPFICSHFPPGFLFILYSVLFHLYLVWRPSSKTFCKRYLSSSHSFPLQPSWKTFQYFITHLICSLQIASVSTLPGLRLAQISIVQKNILWWWICSIPAFFNMVTIKHMWDYWTPEIWLVHLRTWILNFTYF